MRFIFTKLHKIITAIILVCFVLTPLFFFTTKTSAAPNYQMNYQGKLTNASNVAVPDGTYNMRFWLLTTSSIGTTSAVWTESLTGSNKVQVTNGLFSVMLGSTSPLTGVDFNQTLYLGVEIGGTSTPTWDGEMSPRKVLGTVPSAFEADKLDGLTSTQFVRTDATSSISASTADTLLSITQNGAGDLLNLFDGSDEVFSVIDGGNVGIGSTTPSRKFTLAGGDAWIGGNLTATGTATFGALSISGVSSFGYASTTGLTATNGYFTNATTSNLKITGLTGSRALFTDANSLLTTTGLSQYLIDAITDETGTGSLVFSTNPLLAGFRSNASSTIGDGTGTGGLTVNGSASTSLNQYIGGHISIGTTTNTGVFTIDGTTTANTIDLVKIVAPSGYAGGGGSYFKMVDSTGASKFVINSFGNFQALAGATFSGNAGTSPANATIVSSPTGTGNGIAIKSGAAYTGEYFRILDSSDNYIFNVSGTTTNVGIGTSTPSRKLTVNGEGYFANNLTAASSTITYASSTGLTATNANFTNATTSALYTTTLGLNSEYFTDLTGSGLQNTSNALTCITSNSSTFGCLTAADWTIFNNKVSSTSIDTSAELASLITDETGSAGNLVFSGNPLLAGFRSSASSTIGDGTATGGLTIYGNGTTTGNAYFAGNVGIGTSNPSAPLHITTAPSGVSPYAQIWLEADGSAVNKGAAVALTSKFLSTTKSWYFGAGDGGGATNNNFRIVELGAPNTDRFVIQADTGYVGIGTTSPSNTLTVDGSIYGTSITTTGTGAFGNLSVSGVSSLGFASSTSLTVSGNTYLSGLSDGCLSTVSGLVTSSGVACGSGSGSQDWRKNASLTAISPTTTVGILINASSTIGDGTGAGGLTIYGGATTTGNAYFASNVGIGSTSPNARLTISGVAGSQTPLIQTASSTGSTTFAVLASGDVEVAGNFVNAGVQWTARDAGGTSNFWTGVAYGNGRFVAVGNTTGPYRFMTSPDGVRWATSSAAGGNDDWTDVTYGNGLFVAVGDSFVGSADAVMTSPDGINWTARSVAGDNDIWQSVTYGNGLFVAVGDKNFGDAVMTSPDGINWTVRSDAGTEAWFSVTYGNGLFVALSAGGAGNRLMTSPDGITWTGRSILGNDDSWTSIAYGNGLFVAVSDASSGGDAIATSPDGINWTARSVAGDNDTWNSVTYGNGLFVAVADNSASSLDTVMTSPDGINWTVRNPTSNFDTWNSVTYGNGLFVAVGYGDFGGNSVMTSGKTSSNKLAINNIYQGGMSVLGGAFNIGTTTATTSAFATNILNIASTTGTSVFNILQNGYVGIGSTSPSRLLTVAGDIFTPYNISAGSSTITYASSTGITTTNLYATNATTSNLKITGVTASRALFTDASNLLTTSGVSQYLIDSLSDETGTGSLVFSNSPTFTGATTFAYASTTGLTISGNLFVGATSTLATTTTANLEVAGNFVSRGVVWTDRAAGSGFWNASAYGNGRFVAVTGSGSANRAMFSSDGVNWTVTGGGSSQEDWYGVTYGNGLFVAVGVFSTTNGAVMTSPDGVNWARKLLATTTVYTSVAYGNGTFVAVSGSNDTVSAVMTSPDGITWTDQVPVSGYWSSVVYGDNKLFVAVSADGKVMTSPDGITWTSRTAASASGWMSVTYGGGIYVAVASDGSVMTSPNGTTWTSRTAASASAWTSVTYGDGLFAAIASGAIMTSPDGIVWTSRALSTVRSWTGLSYGNGMFVGVSQSGSRAITSGRVDEIRLATGNIYQGGMSVLGGAFNIGTSTATTSAFATNILNIASTTGTSVFNILKNGFVGIGSTSPSRLLTVNGDIFTPYNISAGSSTITYASSTGLSATNLAVTGTSTLAVLTASGNSYVAGNLSVGSSILPLSKFEVTVGDAFGGTANMVRIRGISTTNGFGAGLAFGADGTGTNAGLVGSKIVFVRTNANSIGDLAFFTNSSGITTTDGSNERMRILSTGQVGIGTGTPSAILAVSASSSNAGANLFTFASSSGSSMLTLDARGVLTFGTSTSADIFINGGSQTRNPQQNGNNIAIGNGTMWYASTTAAAQFNIAIGAQALLGSSSVPMSGDHNVAIGIQALAANASGTSNTAIGSLTLANNTIGYSNTAVGYGSMINNATGYQNAALGMASLQANTQGYQNAAFGYASLLNNTLGTNNTAMGWGSLVSNVSGVESTAVGSQALFQNTGSYNTAQGFKSLYANISGIANTAMGWQALVGNTSGLGNTGVGYGVLTGTQDGSFNTAIGIAAGVTNVTGTSNTYIGVSADGSGSGFSTSTAIGAKAVVGCSNCMVLGGTGANYVNVGIGTTTPSALLTIGSTTMTGARVAGIKQHFGFVNSTQDAVYYGNETYITNVPTATSTLVGGMIRIADTSALGNVVRGFEAQAYRGTNTKGENTGLSGFGRTFGVRGTTLGDAGDTYLPAGIFAETQGTTQGNALRAYSGTITTEKLVSLFHDGSNFTGTGLQMNFGNAGGSFAATSSAKFLDLQVAGTSKFTISANGSTTIGDGVTSASLRIPFGGICVDNDGSCVSTTTGQIRSVTSALGNSDLAETYFSNQTLHAGEIVAITGGLSIKRAVEETEKDIIGVVSTKPGLTLGFDDTSLIPGENSYPIGLKGRVPIKLSTENGPIKKGDRIALSSIPGVGMKATESSRVVGIALEDYDGTRAYTDGFLNQFGDDMYKEKVVAQKNTDLRAQDGCSYGGGNALGEEECVAQKVIKQKTVTPKTDTTREDTLRAFAQESALETRSAHGEVAYVGQALMFIDLAWYQVDRESLVLSELASSTLLVNAEEGETIWSRVKTLAQNFVDGVLTVAGIKAERVEVSRELCVDNVCVTADDLRALLQNAHQAPQNQPAQNTGGEGGGASVDQGSENQQQNTGGDSGGGTNIETPPAPTTESGGEEPSQQNTEETPPPTPEPEPPAPEPETSPQPPAQ